MRAVLCAIVFLLVLAFPGKVSAGEAYYLLLFGSQRQSNNPNYSHSFATFVRAHWPEGSGPRSACLEVHTISWLPSNLIIRTRALLPEPGHNFELHRTIRFALATDQRVSLWGPYQICPELYARAMGRIRQLESGCVLYKANNTGYHSARVTNCIHAIDALYRGTRRIVASPGWGERASYFLMRNLMSWVIDPNCKHSWVASALGLDAYPIIYRDMEPPRSGPIIGPVFRLFGHERNLRATFGPPY